LVRSSGIGSSEHAPFRIEPQRGQVAENDIEPARGKQWGIFHEDVARSNFANDPCHFRPEPGPCADDTGPPSSCADVLTGKAARNDVNTASPWLAVKCPHVIPDRERRQKSVILPLDEYSCGVGFVFNGADCPPSKQVSGKYASTSACEKSQLIHATPLDHLGVLDLLGLARIKKGPWLILLFSLSFSLFWDIREIKRGKRGK